MASAATVIHVNAPAGGGAQIPRAVVRHFVRLRWGVCSALSRVGTNALIARLRKRSGTKAGVYVLVHCPPSLTAQEVIRGVLSGRVQVLYVGLSETEGRHRASTLVCGLTGGSQAHEAARELNQDHPDLRGSDHLRLIVCSYSPAYSLENFLISEYGRFFGVYPRLNHGRSARSSTHVRKLPRRVTWENLLRPSELWLGLSNEDSLVA